MTTTTNVPMQQIKTIELPAPGYPMLTRMISSALFADEKGKEVVWVVGGPLPLVTYLKVIRMFNDHGGVEIYSVTADGKAGTRNFVPMHWVRMTEEAMPIDVFVEELQAAESDGADDDEPEDPEEPVVTNGQPVS